jgi:alpha-galactosidase
VKAAAAFSWLLLLGTVFMMSQQGVKSHCSGAAEIIAAATNQDIPLDAQHPSSEWQRAAAVSFCADWKGKNADAERATRVKALWSSQKLFLRFECRYRELNLFSDSEPNGRRDHLWDRDVAEAFVQPDPLRERYYKEFEVSPNGMWIDLNISPGALEALNSGMQRSVWVNENARTWAAELAIPMNSLTSHFDPDQVWRVNFFRVEGKQEPRFYSAWQPTNTPEPNFHVPRAFGRMRFAPAKSPLK